MSSGSNCPTTFDSANPCCAILQSISEGVFTIDLEKRITFLNRAAEAAQGFCIWITEEPGCLSRVWR